MCVCVDFHFCVCDTSLLAASTPTGLSAVSLRHTWHTHTNPSCETYLLFAFIVHTANCDLPSSAQLLYVQILTYVVCVCVCACVSAYTLLCKNPLTRSLCCWVLLSPSLSIHTLHAVSLSTLVWVCSGDLRRNRSEFCLRVRISKHKFCLRVWSANTSSVWEFDQQTRVLSESLISKHEFCLRVWISKHEFCLRVW